MKKTVYIETGSLDPAWNLAAEQYIFDKLPKDRDYLMLWQNDNTIVIGKHQNTAEEINAAYVRQHGIRVVRRLSGGGAVYHDLGNLNYSLITDAPEAGQLDIRFFCLPVIETLKSFGVDAVLSGRNDMTVDGKKFSGNSQYISGGRLLHHGTLMFDSDLSVLSQALKPSQDKYESKGLRSVRSRVTNLKDYFPSGSTIDDFKRELSERITGKDSLRYNLTDDDREAISVVKASRYDTWEWTYGRSPAFSVRKRKKFEGVGTLQLSLNAEKGRIGDLALDGDFFGDGLTERLKERLTGCRLEREELLSCLSDTDIDSCVHGLTAEGLADLILL